MPVTGEAYTDAYAGVITPSNVAKTSLDAKWPSLRRNLIFTFSPCVSTMAWQTFATAFGARDANYHYSPLGCGSHFNETGAVQMAMIDNFNATTKNLGNCFRSGNGTASGHLFGTHQRLRDLRPPMTIHVICEAGTISGSKGEVVVTSGRKFGKAGTQRYGHHIFLEHGNQNVHFVAHNGTTSTVTAGGGKATSAGSLYAATEAINIICSAYSQPIEDDANCEIWVNGTSENLLASANNITATNFSNEVYLMGDRGSTYAMDLKISHVTAWDRVLTTPEKEIISADPVALYRKNPLASTMVYPPWHFDVDVAAGVDVVSLGVLYHDEDSIVLPG